MTGSLVFTAEVIGAATGWLCAIAGVGLPIAIAVAILVALVLMVPLGSASPLGWFCTAIDYARHSRLGLPTPIDEHGDFGVSWSGFECAAVVSIIAKPRLTILSRRGAETGERVPLNALANALRQQDIMLSGIDVVSHSRRIQTRPASVLRQLTGPLPAVPSRTVWIVVRLDARSDAARRRGGGRPGAISTLRTATSRIAEALARHDIDVRILPAAGVRALTDEILGSAEVEPGWTAVRIGDEADSGYTATAPQPALLDRGWSVSGAATTTMVALRPAAGDGQVEVAISWRFTGADNPGLPARRVDGRQLPHLRAHLPVANNNPPDLWFHPVPIADLLSYGFATGGCGQLLGATSNGKAAAVRLCSPSTRIATLVGSAMFLRQTVFRGIATGARIVVRTDRPDLWASLDKAVGNSAELRLISPGAAVPDGYDVLVADGDLQSGGPGITTIFAASTPAALDGIDADVAIVATGNSITVTAGGESIDVDLVTVPAESEFTDGSRGVRVG